MADLWKTSGEYGNRYFEDSDEMVAHMTEMAVRHAYSLTKSGRDTARRRRLKAWIMRGHGDSYDAEMAAGLHRGVPLPRVARRVDDEWVELEWALIEPTVELAEPQDGTDA